MTTGFFGDVRKIAYEGPKSTNPLAFRWYDADRIVLGKRLEEHLRFAVCYWHTFVWTGGDPFGGATFERPWFGDTLEHAKQKADVAFELFTTLGVPFYCFHDADVRPEGATFAENTANLAAAAGFATNFQSEIGGWDTNMTGSCGYGGCNSNSGNWDPTPARPHGIPVR